MARRGGLVVQDSMGFGGKQPNRFGEICPKFPIVSSTLFSSTVFFEFFYKKTAEIAFPAPEGSES